MSGSLPSGRYLRWRVGPYPSARVQTARIGSTCTVIFELIDAATKRLVPAAGLAASYRRPRLSGYATQTVPLIPTLLRPGCWEVRFIGEMLGIAEVQGVTFGPFPETDTAKILIV